MGQQLDLIPAKPFCEIEAANMRRLAIAPHGSKLKAQRENIRIVTACLKAEVDAGKVRVRHHVRVKSRQADQSLSLSVGA